jgi:NAD(P)-dependent dehydrogenase (short-subunit alcohol dehydrogenase family)
MGRLSGKVALITGANSGIGERTAELFAQEGADVVLVARRLEKLKQVEETCKAQGVRAISVSADVSDQADCKRAVQEAIDAFGRVDILVNNAGIGDNHSPITRCDGDYFDHILKVDLYSVFYMMKEALVHMEAAGSGSIVNVSSIGGTAYCAGVSYSTAKTGVISMSKNVAIQHVGTGIRVNVVAPGPTQTPLMNEENRASLDEAFAEITCRHLDITAPMATAEDQAQAILFFASDASKCCNGQVLVVDSGCTL